MPRFAFIAAEATARIGTSIWLPFITHCGHHPLIHLGLGLAAFAVRGSRLIRGTPLELKHDELLIAARYVNGETTIALARATGISRYEINRILGAAGVRRRQAPSIVTLPEDTKAWIVRLYEAGITATRIGRELGFEISLVSMVLKVEGVPVHRGRQQRDASSRGTAGRVSGQGEVQAQSPSGMRGERPFIEEPEPPEPSVDAPTAHARRTAYRIVAAYLEGESIDNLSRRFRYPAWRIVRILKSANVTLLVEAQRPPSSEPGLAGPMVPHPPGDEASDDDPNADAVWRALVQAHYEHMDALESEPGSSV